MIAVYNDAEWLSDPAWSGRRWRAFMPEGQLIVYAEDSGCPGAWEVRLNRRPTAAASGDEGNERDGKLRARAVYEALTARLREV